MSDLDPAERMELSGKLPPWRRPIACADRLCGADDCPTCHPETEQAAWEAFAWAHPHEAYETFPERFWELMQRLHPHVTREQMEQTLKET